MMKSLIVTTAAMVALSAPAFAQTAPAATTTTHTSTSSSSASSSGPAPVIRHVHHVRHHAHHTRKHTRTSANDSMSTDQGMSGSSNAGAPTSGSQPSDQGAAPGNPSPQ